jgi:hypothetical protein
MKWLLSILPLVCLTLVECKKSVSPEIQKYYYSYYPLEKGHWVAYDVIHIEHTNLGSDTLHYALKEVITERFIDNQGDTAFRIERRWKFNPTDEYIIKDIWYANTYSTRADKIEENIRYTKLVFPILSEKRWDGNAFNTLEKWEYRYDSLHLSRSINGLQFDSTIRVVQSNVINPFQEKVASEIYANHIGLIKKSYKNIDNGLGREVYMTITGYGVE